MKSIFNSKFFIDHSSIIHATTIHIYSR